jgi:hypothetical protein
MTVGADFHPEVADRGTHLKSVAAGAGNGPDFILRMNLLFHKKLLYKFYQSQKNNALNIDKGRDKCKHFYCS